MEIVGEYDSWSAVRNSFKLDGYDPEKFVNEHANV